MISVLQSINITLTELITRSITVAKKVPAKTPESIKDININIYNKLQRNQTEIK